VLRTAHELNPLPTTLGEAVRLRDLVDVLAVPVGQSAPDRPAARIGEIIGPHSLNAGVPSRNGSPANFPPRSARR
jgi:hypothetical protein